MLKTIILCLSLFFGSLNKVEGQISWDYKRYLSDSIGFRFFEKVKGRTWYKKNNIKFEILYVFLDTAWNNFAKRITNLSEINSELIEEFIKTKEYEQLFDLIKRNQKSMSIGGHGGRGFYVLIKKLTKRQIRRLKKV